MFSGAYMHIYIYIHTHIHRYTYMYINLGENINLKMIRKSDSSLLEMGQEMRNGSQGDYLNLDFLQVLLV